MIRQQNKQSCPKWTDFPDIELYMDQVISVLERYLSPFYGEDKVITSTMINNYVKQKILPPPQNKRYCRSQLAMLFIICVWKRFLQLSEISLLLENLERGRDAEEVYQIFSREFNRAMESISESAPLEDPTENAVRAACVAFAAMDASRTAFLKARETWPDPQEEEKKEKSEQKKEKKKEEKKKDKEKK